MDGFTTVAAGKTNQPNKWYLLMNQKLIGHFVISTGPRDAPLNCQNKVIIIYSRVITMIGKTGKDFS